MKRWLLLWLVMVSTLYPTWGWERCKDCERDSHGKIKRSRAAVAEFKRQHPCPVTLKSSGSCYGWIVDHVIPLQCGGLDTPENMAWQMKAQAHEKDLWEGKCEMFGGLTNGLTLRQAYALHERSQHGQDP